MSEDVVDLKGGSRGRTITRLIFAVFIGSYVGTQIKSKDEMATPFHRWVRGGKLGRKTAWKAIHERSSLRW
jgi:hypothetical protein